MIEKIAALYHIKNITLLLLKAVEKDVKSITMTIRIEASSYSVTKIRIATF